MPEESGLPGPDRVHVGIDVGGTFTDFACLRDGELEIFKLPSTPGNQRLAVETGLAQLDFGSDKPAVVHGTTVATNALLERKGARTALLTTKGFKDVLHIGRQNRARLYRLAQSRPSPLIPTDLCFEVPERINHRGEVVVPMDEDAVASICLELRERQVESLCIVFLYSFLYPEHERAAARIAGRHLPDVPLSLSCDVHPEYREYERTVTTATNAYLQPPVGGYLGELRSALEHESFRVMQSSGGAIGLSTARRLPVQLLVSGPAAGVAGALTLAQAALGDSAPNILTLDMGGTSTDTALCQGELPMTAESEIGGLPVRIPMVDIHTVGAGGGSIAAVDSAGALRVGPRSAGAEPGPACYGRGGTQPTVTDANLILNRLPRNPAWRGGGLSRLHPHLALEALRRLQDEVGADSPQVAAAAVIDIVNASMERALRRISVERGHDPADFTLVPFGGAGPLHACALAEALNLRRILVPSHPGVLSAQGLLLADVTHSASHALLQPAAAVAAAPEDAEALVRQLAREVERVLEVEELPRLHLSLQAEMRYAGQSYELPVPLALPLEKGAFLRAEQDFHTVHARRFGYSDPETSADIVALRVTGRGRRQTPSSAPAAQPPARSAPEPAGQASVHLHAERAEQVPCYARERLVPGHSMEGPAIIFQYDATTLLLPGWQARVDAERNLSLTRGAP